MNNFFFRIFLIAIKSFMACSAVKNVVCGIMAVLYNMLYDKLTIFNLSPPPPHRSNLLYINYLLCFCANENRREKHFFVPLSHITIFIFYIITYHANHLQQKET
jgi:hypothetical protein